LLIRDSVEIQNHLGHGVPTPAGFELFDWLRTKETKIIFAQTKTISDFIFIRNRERFYHCSEVVQSEFWGLWN
jgi:hypothetical protein